VAKLVDDEQNAQVSREAERRCDRKGQPTGLVILKRIALFKST